VVEVISYVNDVSIIETQLFGNNIHARPVSKRRETARCLAAGMNAGGPPAASLASFERRCQHDGEVELLVFVVFYLPLMVFMSSSNFFQFCAHGKAAPAEEEALLVLAILP